MRFSKRGTIAPWARRLVSLASLLAVAGTATPAAAAVVPLARVRAQALAQHPELVAEDARIAAAVASVQETRSARRPRIGADVDVWTGPGGQLVEIPGDPPLLVGGAPALGEEEAFNLVGRWSADVGLDWRLYDFGRTSAAERAAEWETRARRAQRAATAVGLIRAVDAAYLDWLDAFERARLRATAVERARSRLVRLEAQLEAGAAAEAELWPARADLAARALTLAEAEQLLAEARLALESAASVDLAPEAEPDVTLLELGEEPQAGSDDGALPRDETTQALEARAQAAEAEAQKHERELTPELVGNLSFGVRGQDQSVFPNYRAGLGLSVPIWEGGENAARADAARARARALRAERAEAEAEHERTLDRHRLALREARRRVDLAARLVEVAQGRLQSVEGRPEGSPERADELDRARAARDEALEALLAARIDRTFAALRLRDPIPE